MDENSTELTRFGRIVWTIVFIAIVVFCIYKYISSRDLFGKYKDMNLSAEELVQLSDGEHNKTLETLSEKGVYISNDVILGGDEYEEELKTIDSDIEGMTQYDKYAMGLDIEDDSDTDSDGLTDKEEIETYGSDPLKASTAGDMYLDGYKIANGMDVSTYYDYANDLTFPQNECSYVSLTITNPLDSRAAVSEMNYGENELGFSPYKTILVSNYSGEINIDLSKIDIPDDVKESKIVVYGSTLGGEITKYDSDVSDGILTFTKDSDNNIPQYFYITDKSTKIKDGLYSMTETGINVVLENTYEEPYGLAYFNLWACLWGGAVPKVYLNDTGNEAMNEIVKDKWKAALDYQIWEHDVYTEYTDDQIFVYMDREDIEKKKEFLNKMPIIKETTDPDFHHCGLIEELCSFYTYDTICGMNYKGEEDYDVRDHSSFDIVEDTLPFENFGTKYHTSGMCAGIAYLTAEAYNNSYVIDKGSAGFGAFKIGNLTWDLTTDEENATLLDYGLNDYKTSTWVKDHSSKVTDGTNGETMNVIDESTLTEGEQQFINYIACRWGQVNQLILAKTSYKDQSETKYPYSNIERLKNELDQNKVLIGNINIAVPISETRKLAAGHSIDIYGYEECDGYDNLLVYDSNYPNQSGLKIKIMPFTDSQGRELYEFSYVTPDYKMNSMDTELYDFSIIDDYFNFIQK